MNTDQSIDDFDFGAPPPDEHIDKAKLQQKVTDMLVVIDTAQSLLRTATAELENAGKEKVLTSIPSYKWVINWKHNDI